jgi:hypothetical protein
VLDEELAARSASEGNGRQADLNGRSHSWWSQLLEILRGQSLTLRLAFSLPALLVVFGGAWLLFETSRLRTRLAEAQQVAETRHQLTQTQAQKIAELEKEAKTLADEQKSLQDQLQAVKGGSSNLPTRSPRSGPGSVIFALAIGLLRDSGTEPQALNIPRGVEEVSLMLNISEIKFPRYRVKVLNIDGKETFNSKGIKPETTKSGDHLMVKVPVRNFASGDNILAISGINAAGEAEIISKTIIKVRKQ